MVLAGTASAANELDVSTYLAAVDQPTQITRASLRSDAIAGQAVEREDRIETGEKGRADLALGSDTHIYLASNSGILIRQLHSSGSDDGGLKGIVTVEKGMVRMQSVAGSRPTHLRIEQETLKVDVRDSASFMVNHNAGTDIVCLFDGKIQVRARTDRRELKSPNTCFLYNGDTKASSVRNMESKQVQAVLALTKVNAPVRKPSSPVIAKSNSAVTTSSAKAPAAPSKPAAIRSAAKPAAATTTSKAGGEAKPASVAVTNAGGLLNMMRRPSPDGLAKVTQPAPAARPVAVSPSRPANIPKPVATSKPQPVTASKAQAPTRAPTKPVAVAKPVAVSKPARTTSKPATTASRVPVAAPAKVSKPAARKPSRKYPTPSGKLEQWTINLAAYDRISESEDLIVELRKLGYFPHIEKAENSKGKTIYRLSIQGMGSRIEAEAAANKILSNTSAESYWLRNIYLTR